MARILCALALAGAFAGSALAATTAPIRVTVRDYPLVCGRATGLFKIVFPAAASVPARIPAAAVTVNGRVAAKVAVTGRTVSVTVPRRPGITCLSIVLGKLTITFAPRAHVVAHTARTAKVVRLPRTYAASVSS
jgi:hypothetical protein